MSAKVYLHPTFDSWTDDDKERRIHQLSRATGLTVMRINNIWRFDRLRLVASLPSPKKAVRYKQEHNL